MNERLLERVAFLFLERSVKNDIKRGDFKRKVQGGMRNEKN